MIVPRTSRYHDATSDATTLTALERVVFQSALRPRTRRLLVTTMLNYYALQDDPFSPTSHPAWFFASQSHTAALQTLLESLKAGEDFAILLGEPGGAEVFHFCSLISLQNLMLPGAIPKIRACLISASCQDLLKS